MKDTRTYRPCVRVLIIKEDKVLLGTKTWKGRTLRSVPGGGIDPGMSKELACIQESLEEVGVIIEDPTFTGVDLLYDVEMPQPERRKIYRGGHDFWYVARYVGEDRTYRGSEGDNQTYKWVNFNNFANLMSKTNGEDKFTDVARRAMDAAIKIIKEKRKRKPLW